MKKRLPVFLLLVTSGFYSNVNAQITITNADMLSVNDTFRLSTTIDTWSIDPTLTGANYTWDFSFLTPNAQDVDTAVSVGSTPFLYQVYFNNVFVYPAWKADFAIAGQGFDISGIVTISDVYDYFKNSSSKYENVGFGSTISGVPSSTRKDPIEVVYEFPLNYLDTYTNYSEYEFSVPTIMTYKQQMDKAAEVDGWGTVITPYGTFNALRVKFTLDITDSIYIDAVGFPFVTPRPQSYEYHWLAAGEGVPVLKLAATTGDIVTQITYKDFYIPNIGIYEDKTDISLSVYPNPAANNVYITSDVSINSIILFDTFGREVYSDGVSGTNHVLDINENWSNGIYFVEVRNANGLKREKLVIQR
jgi:Secretion system C-terminal sorting domain